MKSRKSEKTCKKNSNRSHRGRKMSDGPGDDAQQPESDKANDLTGRAKKRMWFQERYKTDSGNNRSVKQKIVCKFFSSTGRCRNGADCQFVHDRELGPIQPRRIIPEPCKFLYTGYQSCGKGDMCHFSHDLAAFKCPEMFGKRYSICGLRECRFDHSPINTELDAMGFAKTYKQYILSLGSEGDPRWKYYLEDKDEYEVLEESTRKDPGNLFNVRVGL